MAWPMLAGTFAMNAYGLTDGWFVARLGTLPLAAMAFTIPVTMLMTCIAIGLGSGTTTLMSHALGRGDKNAAARIVTHGITLVIVISIGLAVLCYLFADWIFSRLGADAETMPMIHAFMNTWYLGAPFIAMPMLASGVLISSGDSATASRRMVISAVINAVLNPLFIYGYLGLPAMGIRGSALATVIAQGVCSIWILWVLHRRHHLLKFGAPVWRGALASIRHILGFGIPGMMSMLLMPMASSVMTWILSRFGTAVIAANGAAGRIEMIAFVIPMALGISLTPFISQNFGAGRIDRVNEGVKLAIRFALLYGLFAAAVFCSLAHVIAAAFSEDPAVVAVLTAYIRITAIGYGMTEVHRYCTFFLIGLQRPAQAMALDVLRVAILLAPISYIGAIVVGAYGVFWGRLIADILCGSMGMLWVAHTGRRVAKELARKTQESTADVLSCA